MGITLDKQEAVTRFARALTLCQDQATVTETLHFPPDQSDGACGSSPRSRVGLGSARSRARFYAAFSPCELTDNCACVLKIVRSTSISMKTFFSSGQPPA